MTITPINFPTPTDFSEIDISGGNINGVTIGNITPGEATFSSISLQNTSTLPLYTGANFSAELFGGSSCLENALLGADVREDITVTLSNGITSTFFRTEYMFDGTYNSAMRFDTGTSTINATWDPVIEQRAGLVAISFVKAFLPESVTLKVLKQGGTFETLETFNPQTDNKAFYTWYLGQDVNFEALEIEFTSSTIQPRITQLEYFLARNFGRYFVHPLTASTFEQQMEIPLLKIGSSTQSTDISPDFVSTDLIKVGVLDNTTPVEGDIWYDGEFLRLQKNSIESIVNTNFQKSSSQVTRGLVLSGTPGNTTFEISAGLATYYDSHTDPENPTRFELNYPGDSIAISSVPVATTFAYVGIDRTGTIVYQEFAPTIETLDDTIWLGFITTSDNWATLDLSGPTLVSNSPLNQLALSIGIINIHNRTVAPVIGTLQLSNPEILLYYSGRNWGDSPNNRLFPDIRTISAANPMVFNYLDRNGVTLSTGNTTLNPTQFDNGAGLSNITGDNASVQRVYMSASGSISILYGQQQYNNLNQAIQRFSAETIVKPPVLNGFIQIATIIVRTDADDLNDPNQCRIIGGGKFGDTAGGGASSSVDSLQTVSGSFDANLGRVLYEDSYALISWQATNKQPQFQLKSTAPTSWDNACFNVRKIDGNISTLEGNSVRRGASGRIPLATDTPQYFSRTGAVTADYNMENYGAEWVSTLMRESFVQGFPSYKIEVDLASTSHGIFKIEVKS